jgi:glycosyltransferase involved in cell wall biosynthesis
MFMPIQQIPYVRSGKMKTVAVVHDLAVHLYPEQFTRKDWLLLHVFSAYVARAADLIIAISETTAADLKRYYGRKDGVKVVYHGVNHELFYPRGKGEGSDKPVLGDGGDQIREPFLLFVGQLQPRKNIIALIEAYEKIWQQEKELNLVIAGSHGWLNDEIYKRAKKSVARKQIIMTGRVTDEQLRELYWQAEAYVLPSLYEGFGLPVLEAMACGCPVVASNVSSLPEVAGEAACLFDPRDVNDLVEKINEARNRRDELVSRGLQRAGEFTWDKTARLTLGAIESVS